jgi:hypothetical protein
MVYQDKYHPYNGVLEPRMQMPRAKAIVRKAQLGEIEEWQVVLLAVRHQ